MSAPSVAPASVFNHFDRSLIESEFRGDRPSSRITQQQIDLNTKHFSSSESRNKSQYCVNNKHDCSEDCGVSPVTYKQQASNSTGDSTYSQDSLSDPSPLGCSTQSSSDIKDQTSQLLLENDLHCDLQKKQQLLTASHDDGYWEAYPLPTGVTDDDCDDEEGSVMSEDSSPVVLDSHACVNGNQPLKSSFGCCRKSDRLSHDDGVSPVLLSPIWSLGGNDDCMNCHQIVHQQRDSDFDISGCPSLSRRQEVNHYESLFDESKEYVRSYQGFPTSTILRSTASRSPSKHRYHRSSSSIDSSPQRKNNKSVEDLNSINPFSKGSCDQHHHNNSNAYYASPGMERQNNKGAAEPCYYIQSLPVRRLQLLKYHLLFLFCMCFSVLLGTLFHHSKFHRIQYSLSIEGFECFLPSVFQSGSSADSASCGSKRTINLGALLASDLLILGWGRPDLGNNKNAEAHKKSSSNSNINLISPDWPLFIPTGCCNYPLIQIPSFSEFCRPLSSMIEYRSLLPSSSLAMCFQHEHLISRSFCGDLIETEWKSAPLSCPETFWLSLIEQPSLATQQNSFYYYNHRFAPLFLKWREVTPSLLLSPCYSAIKQERRRRRSPNTIAFLQRDVYRLVSKHPKLVSLARQFSFDCCGESSNEPDQDRHLGNQTAGAKSHHGSTLNKTIQEAQRLVDFLESANVKLYSIGLATPNGLMDHAIWFSHSSPVETLFSGGFPERLHSINSPTSSSVLNASLEFDKFKNSTSEESIVFRLLKQLNFYWDIRQGPTGSVGRPVVLLNETGSNSSAERDAVSLLPHWIESHIRGGDHLLRQFNQSKGLLSPTYPLHGLINWLFTTGAVYLVVFLCWTHSLASPAPVTLVHFPRLIIYLGILLYRVAVLYVIGNRVLSSMVFPSGFDFSDHLVLYLSIGLILTIECVAAEQSHQRIPVPELPVPTETVDRSDDEDDRLISKEQPGSVSSPKLINLLKSGFSSDTEDGVYETDKTASSLTRTPSHDSRTKASTAATSSLSKQQQKPQQRRVSWKWSPAVLCVYLYCFTVFAFLFYASFFTAVFYHHPSESLMGLLVGVVGLYVPFWLLILTGFLSLDKTFASTSVASLK